MLFCLTLVRTLTGASVHHDVRQAEWSAMTDSRRLRMAHHGAVSVDIYRVGGTRMKEKKGPAILKAFGSLSFFSFPPL